MDFNMVAPINQLSYGVVASNIVHSLVQRGHKVRLIPIGPVSLNNPKHEQSIRQAIENGHSFLHHGDCLRLFHQHSLAEFVGTGRRIGFTIFELDKLNHQERHHVRYCDKVLVPSRWAH